MEHATELFFLVVSFYLGIGIVGYHLAKALDKVSGELGTIEDLIRDGINKLDEIELKM